MYGELAGRTANDSRETHRLRETRSRYRLKKACTEILRIVERAQGYGEGRRPRRSSSRSTIWSKVVFPAAGGPSSTTPREACSSRANGSSSYSRRRTNSGGSWSIDSMISQSRCAMTCAHQRHEGCPTQSPKTAKGFGASVAGIGHPAHLSLVQMRRDADPAPG
jgi:hypothetical protein